MSDSRLPVHLSHTLSPLPQVSPDYAAIERQAAAVTRYLPETRRTACLTALTEVCTRGEQHPGELSDLGPNASRCGRTARALGHLNDRIARGILPPDTYAHVRHFGEAHGEAIAKGRERAQRVRAEKAPADKAPVKPVQVAANTPPANDVSAVPKTGTHDA